MILKRATQIVQYSPGEKTKFPHGVTNVHEKAGGEDQLIFSAILCNSVFMAVGESLSPTLGISMSSEFDE